MTRSPLGSLMFTSGQETAHQQRLLLCTDTGVHLQLSQPPQPAPSQQAGRCSSHADRRHRTWRRPPRARARPRGGPTLPHEGLAGVQEDLAALRDHALDGEVFPDVLCLAHFIMHYPTGARNGSQGQAATAAREAGMRGPARFGGSGTGMPTSP